jgi:hypothetical protein
MRRNGGARMDVLNCPPPRRIRSGTATAKRNSLAVRALPRYDQAQVRLAGLAAHRNVSHRRRCRAPRFGREGRIPPPIQLQAHERWMGECPNGQPFDRRARQVASADKSASGKAQIRSARKAKRPHVARACPVRCRPSSCPRLSWASTPSFPGARRGWRGQAPGMTTAHVFTLPAEQRRGTSRANCSSNLSDGFSDIVSRSRSMLAASQSLLTMSGVASRIDAE